MGVAGGVCAWIGEGGAAEGGLKPWEEVEGDVISVDDGAAGGLVGEGEPGDLEDVVGAGDDDLELVAGGGDAGERGAGVGVLAVVEGPGGGDSEEKAIDADGEFG